MKLIKYGIYALLIGFCIANNTNAGLRVALEEEPSISKVILQKNERTCQPELKTFDFSWVENHKNDKSAKWEFLIDFYEKYKDILLIFKKNRPKDIFDDPTKTKMIADWLKQAILNKPLKPYSIRYFLPEVFPLHPDTEKLHVYEKFLINDMERLTVNNKITYEKYPRFPEITYRNKPDSSPEEIVENKEFFGAAQNLLDALYTIGALIRKTEEYRWE